MQNRNILVSSAQLEKELTDIVIKPASAEKANELRNCIEKINCNNQRYNELKINSMLTNAQDLHYIDVPSVLTPYTIKNKLNTKNVSIITRAILQNDEDCLRQLLEAAFSTKRRAEKIPEIQGMKLFQIKETGDFEWVEEAFLCALHHPALLKLFIDHQIKPTNMLILAIKNECYEVMQIIIHNKWAALDYETLVMSTGKSKYLEYLLDNVDQDYLKKMIKENDREHHYYYLHDRRIGSYTLLTKAIESPENNANCIQKLLDLGVNPNTMTYDGHGDYTFDISKKKMTPLMSALDNLSDDVKKEHVISILIDLLFAGADIKKQGTITQEYTSHGENWGHTNRTHVTAIDYLNHFVSVPANNKKYILNILNAWVSLEHTMTLLNKHQFDIVAAESLTQTEKTFPELTIKYFHHFTDTVPLSRIEHYKLTAKTIFLDENKLHPIYQYPNAVELLQRLCAYRQNRESSLFHKLGLFDNTDEERYQEINALANMLLLINHDANHQSEEDSQNINKLISHINQVKEKQEFKAGFTSRHYTSLAGIMQDMENYMDRLVKAKSNGVAGNQVVKVQGGPR